MSRNKHSQKTFMRFITSPFRALGRARDLYVRSITKCGHNMNYTSPVGAGGMFSTIPRSYSLNTSRSEHESEDFAELMRAASARTLVERIDMELVMKQQKEREAKELAKSRSVGMAKIEEDKACEFEDDVGDLYPRSRSYAVRKRSVAHHAF